MSCQKNVLTILSGIVIIKKRKVIITNVIEIDLFREREFLIIAV